MRSQNASESGSLHGFAAETHRVSVGGTADPSVPLKERYDTIKTSKEKMCEHLRMVMNNRNNNAAVAQRNRNNNAAVAQRNRNNNAAE